MSNTQRWIVIVGALLLAATVGFAAWQAGVAHGIEQSGKIVVPPSGPYPYPYPYPYYGWHRPWGFGFGGVLLFFIFWSMVARMIFWRGRWYGRYRGGCYGPEAHLEDWHRRMHERDDSNQRGRERTDNPQGRS